MYQSKLFPLPALRCDPMEYMRRLIKCIQLYSVHDINGAAVCVTVV